MGPPERIHLGELGGNADPSTTAPGILPESTASTTSEAVAVFPYQSYFDDSLLGNALLAQNRNEPIVESTRQKKQESGYALGLHPDSESPVAVRFGAGSGKGGSPVHIIKPGQVLRPSGQVLFPREQVGRGGSFSSFEFGLPFGWLGGGRVTLIIFKTPDASVTWSTDSEIIFHRQRMKIGGGLGPWPLRFPFYTAKSGSTPQGGEPRLSISRATRTALVLRKTALAVPARMRMLFFRARDFTNESAGGTPSEYVFVDMTWPTFAQAGGVTGAQYPVIEVDPLVGRMGCDALREQAAGVQLVDMAGGTLANTFVDVVRYGVL